MQPCNNQLVFIDLDSDGEWFAYDGTTWSRGLVELDVLCTNGSQLFPRGNGYTVGTARQPLTGRDRLLVLGGGDRDSKHNVYYSDNCGRSWSCHSAPQIWNFMDYASIVRAPTSYPQDVTIMAAGGTLTGDRQGTILVTDDAGFTWERPACTNLSTCQLDCLEVFRTICLLEPFQADAFGNCDESNPNWGLCYLLPDWPLYPGMVWPPGPEGCPDQQFNHMCPGGLAADWDTLWMWTEVHDGGRVWSLGSGDLTTGWVLTNATWGGYGRKVRAALPVGADLEYSAAPPNPHTQVFIKGTARGTGCWFSTDYMLEDTWAGFDLSTNSMNAFATARTALGPWTSWSGVRDAPWAPRASAALASARGMTSAWFASGNNWTAGVPGLPTYADVWQVRVCLIVLVATKPACRLYRC